MRAASQTGGGTRVAVAPGGKERFLTIRTDGSQDAMSHCVGWPAAATHTGWALPSLPDLPAHTTRVSQVEAPSGGWSRSWASQP